MESFLQNTLECTRKYGEVEQLTMEVLSSANSMFGLDLQSNAWLLDAGVLLPPPFLGPTTNYGHLIGHNIIQDSSGSSRHPSGASSQDVRSDSVLTWSDQPGHGKQPQVYKTKICRNWATTGACPYKIRCQFAHGTEELRSAQRHPKFRSQLCQKFPLGQCAFGEKCHFIHPPGVSNGNPRQVLDDGSPISAYAGNRAYSADFFELVSSPTKSSASSGYWSDGPSEPESPKSADAEDMYSCWLKLVDDIVP